MMNKYLELYLKAYTSKVAFDFTKKNEDKKLHPLARLGIGMGSGILGEGAYIAASMPVIKAHSKLERINKIIDRLKKQEAGASVSHLNTISNRASRLTNTANKVGRVLKFLPRLDRTGTFLTGLISAPLVTAGLTSHLLDKNKG